MRSTVPDSDTDVLLIVDSLPDGRMARVREFEEVEQVFESGWADPVP